jgi:hypothetical protein
LILLSDVVLSTDRFAEEGIVTWVRWYLVPDSATAIWPPLLSNWESRWHLPTILRQVIGAFISLGTILGDARWQLVAADETAFHSETQCMTHAEILGLLIRKTRRSQSL